MIRQILYELAFFATPFVLYAAFLWATQKGVLHPDAWSMRRVAWLTIAALILVVGSFVVLAQLSGVPPGSTYVPAHMEDGKLVPGATR